MGWYPASGAPCFLLMGMGIHIGFRVNNCDRGFIHIPEELKGIVTAEGLTDVFKKIVSPEMSFLLTCDRSPWWMSTRRTSLELPLAVPRLPLLGTAVLLLPLPDLLLTVAA